MIRPPPGDVGDRAEEQRRQRKIRDRSLALLAIGSALLLPPVARMFEVPATIAGMPIVLIYVFVVWVLLIVGTAVLSRHLKDAQDTDERGALTGREPGP